jgi:hypothetical protein
MRQGLIIKIIVDRIFLCNKSCHKKRDYGDFMNNVKKACLSMEDIHSILTNGMKECENKDKEKTVLENIAIRLDEKLYKNGQIQRRGDFSDTIITI